MKNLQKGFISQIILVVIALLIIGGGVYVYTNKKSNKENVNIVESAATDQTRKDDSGVKTSVSISEKVIIGKQNENRLNWERLELGSLKVNIEKSDIPQEYFLPGIFICIPNEDRPIYLIYEVNDKILGAGGGIIPAPSGEKREYVYDIVLPSSDLYIKEFSQYINSTYGKNYNWVDYSQKGFDIGNFKLPLSMNIYSQTKQLPDAVHCNNVDSSIPKILQVIMKAS
ncbi:hypothetical protein A2917_00880 [Candidatus Nomurabacteria bacterium RIFCSPLOWO2_01_FULL_42_17]|uniref:Uncharacterized protein n=1 Tax=Candidatus Nomurabacteria bacterium RIFCSPLOWO2_01_FULL_42_17 TaxID=1801780 RepID=A0A1F6XM84_9BACT|nr:MAG: hypothetical protein A2917_00880 [Candidatus Nomurabacteria bacterium RIFCSPLOWO2_01_FULL_42_17]